MKRTIPALMFTLAIFSNVPSFAQAAGNAAVFNKNATVYGTPTSGGVDLNIYNQSSNFSNLLEANVMANVKATSFVAIFSLTQAGKTAEEAEGLLRNRMEAFRQALKAEGLTDQQIFIDPVSHVPTYEMEVTEKKFSKTFNEVPSGFEIRKNIHITFHEHNQVNSLIALAARSEVYDLVKVDYFVDNLDALLQQLRGEALRILMTKKAVLEKAGLHTRFVQVGEKYGSSYPFERYSQYVAYKSGVTPTYMTAYKKGQPQQAVQYNYAEKNKTIYYEKISEKQFDHIINPVVNEPEVQVYLSLKGQYEIFNLETEAVQKAYDQKMRELQLREQELAIREREKALKEERTVAKKSK
jgi:uncharacterized protein YggE